MCFFFIFCCISDYFLYRSHVKKKKSNVFTGGSKSRCPDIRPIFCNHKSPPGFHVDDAIDEGKTRLTAATIDESAANLIRR